MDATDFTPFLERSRVVAAIKSFLDQFVPSDLTCTRGIYLVGNMGSGKSRFIRATLHHLHYHVIVYDVSTGHGKNICAELSEQTIAPVNVLDRMRRISKQTVVLLEDIDALFSGDKTSGISAFIKLVRSKHTRKQQTSDAKSVYPIICIGNAGHQSKYIHELMNVCQTIHLPTPTTAQLGAILAHVFPAMDAALSAQLVKTANGDLRKFTAMCKFYEKRTTDDTRTLLNSQWTTDYSSEIKQLTWNIFNQPHSIHEHLTLLDESSRTTTAMLIHENMADFAHRVSSKHRFMQFYHIFLTSVCEADIIDQATFQKQLWKFSELSSLIKIFYTHLLFHTWFPSQPNIWSSAEDIRFTKILTKYSTEYNHAGFIRDICFKTGLDVNDMYDLFFQLSITPSPLVKHWLSNDCELSQIDIARMDKIIRRLMSPTDADLHNDASVES